jgi:predicted permease
MDYNLQVDLRAVLATFAMGALAGIGFGLMPALVSTRAQVASALKEGTLTGRRRYRRFGLRNLFVVYQVAAAMMLLLMIGYVLVGYHNTAHLDPGFDTSRLDVFTLDPARDGYSAAESSALLTELPGRLAQVSGVSGATVADRIPLGFGTAVPDLAVSVSRGNAGDFSMQVLVQQIGANYFATLGLPLVSGTEFSERDERREVHANEIPVVINQTAARVLFPEGNVLGARIRAGSFSHTVIGVVRDAKPGFMNAKPMATLFRPMSLLNSPRGLPQGATVVVRGAGVDTLAAVRRALAATEPRLTILNPQALSEFLAEAGRAVEWSSALNGGIALFGLILAAIGLAGVTAQEVVRRRKEIGIRMALGARRRQVLWLVLAQSAVMVTVGTAIGFAGGFGVSRALSSLTSQLSDVFGEGTGDRALTVGAPALLIALAAIACYLPARRSMRIDPLTALREE